MSTTSCPHGHAVDASERTCPTCGVEPIAAAAALGASPGPERARDTAASPLSSPPHSGASTAAFFFYVAATLSAAAGLIILIEYMSIRRVRGIDHLEVVWIFGVIVFTSLTAAALCFFGYAIDLLRTIIAEARAARGTSDAPPR